MPTSLSSAFEVICTNTNVVRIQFQCCISKRDLVLSYPRLLGNSIILECRTVQKLLVQPGTQQFIGVGMFIWTQGELITQRFLADASFSSTASTQMIPYESISYPDSS